MQMLFSKFFQQIGISFHYTYAPRNLNKFIIKGNMGMSMLDDPVYLLLIM